jgi:hypothetical protein
MPVKNSRSDDGQPFSRIDFFTEMGPLRPARRFLELNERSCLTFAMKQGDILCVGCGRFDLSALTHMTTIAFPIRISQQSIGVRAQEYPLVIN